MRTCRIVEILCRILPLKAWRGDTLGRHLGRCPACRSNLALREEAEAYVILPEATDRPDPIWPAVEARIKTTPAAPGRPSVPLSALWKPAVAIGVVAGLMILIFLVSRPPRPASTALPNARIEDFRLDSVEAWGKPTQALVYQARDSQITIIWVR
jgi:hypothetical protein